MRINDEKHGHLTGAEQSPPIDSTREIHLKKRSSPKTVPSLHLDPYHIWLFLCQYLLYSQHSALTTQPQSKPPSSHNSYTLIVIPIHASPPAPKRRCSRIRSSCSSKGWCSPSKRRPSPSTRWSSHKWPRSSRPRRPCPNYRRKETRLWKGGSSLFRCYKSFRRSNHR